MIFGLLLAGSAYVVFGSGAVAGVVAESPLGAAADAGPGSGPGVAACFAPGKGFAPGKTGEQWSCTTGASTEAPAADCTRLDLPLANVTWGCATRPTSSVVCVSDDQFCGQFVPGEPLPSDVDSNGRSLTHPGKLPYEDNH